MEQAVEATQFGEHNDSIVISRPLNDIIEASFETQPVGNDRSLDSVYGPYYSVKSCRHRTTPAKPAAQVLKSSLNRTEPGLLKSFIQPYVIPGLLPYIEVGMENWFCNLSEVTILSAQIGINLVSLQGHDGVSRFNEVITVIQKVLIQTKGNLIKLFCDNNVTSIIAVWNTHSTSSPESCAQAVCAGKRLMTELAKLESAVCIGIASGKVFAGVVGVTSGRREFSLIGDALSLANRLVIAAAKSEHLKIIIDEATAHGSQNRTVCKFNEQIRLRSKGELINTYFPEDVSKRHRLALTRAADGESTKDILTALEDSEENLLTHQIFSFRMANLDLFELEKTKILASIKQKGSLVLLRGHRGVGKSKLVQNAMIAARDQLMIEPYLLAFSAEPHQHNEQFEGLFGLYQRLLVFSRTELKDFASDEEQFLRKFLKSNRHCYNSVSYAASCLDHLADFVQAISDQTVADLKLSKRKYLHITELRDCASLVLEGLLNFMAEAVKTHLNSHIVLVLDNFQLFGQESAKVLAKVLPRVNLMVIGILTVGRCSNQRVREVQETFREMKPLVIELKPLSADQLGQLFNSYCTARFAEVDCVLSPELSAYIISRTNGNTLTALSFLDALYCKDYISNRGTKKVTSTDRFKEVLENSRGEEFIVTPVTLVREKGHLLNALTINEISVLCLASAFGDSFDDNLIEEINFFPMLQGNNIKTCLERLSKLGLIECLGPQQSYRPYRFTEPIMKNVVYERMLYSQRRLIHKQYREHFKINPIPNYIFHGLDPQVQSLIAENTLHFHFTHSSHYKNDKKNYDRLVIELIKANVIHDCRKVSSATEQVFACSFGKFSSDDFKPPQSRYLVVTSSYFSYYATEERFSHSPDLYVLRVSHSDIAEVVFSVKLANFSTTPVENTHTKSVSLRASVRRASKSWPSRCSTWASNLSVGPSHPERANKLKYLLEYLRLVCLHERLSREFGNIILPFRLNKKATVSSSAAEGDEGSTEASSSSSQADSLHGSDPFQPKSTSAGLSKLYLEERAVLKTLFVDTLSWFFNKILNKKLAQRAPVFENEQSIEG